MTLNLKLQWISTSPRGQIKFLKNYYFRDSNDAQSETTVDVNISQGPNLRPPAFERAIYDAQVIFIF